MSSLRKEYEKGMRSHKLTAQAMWEILTPQIIDYLESKDEFIEISQQIISAINNTNYENLITLFVSDYCQRAFKPFFVENVLILIFNFGILI